jgi:hypothetical protein
MLSDKINFLYGITIRMDEGKDVLPSAEIEEERVGLEIGDTVVVLGGQLNKTVGKIYGFSADRLLILPKGVTDRVVRIPLVDGGPDPEMGVDNIVILKKAASPGFVAMIDMRAGQYVETFSSDSKPTGIYKVISVNEFDDSAVIEDEGGGQSELLFAFAGISTELPFEVIRTREAPALSEGKDRAEGKESTEDKEAPTQEPMPSQLVEEDDILEEGQAPSLAEQETIGEALTFFIDKGLEEITTADRIYDDVYQRSEMLSQMILLLPRSQRRDPVRLQEVRRIVEQFIILRNSVVSYNAVGDPSGMQSTSIETLAELISRPSVYLARKIANVSKVVYMEHHKDLDLDPNPGVIEEGVYGDYEADTLKRGELIMKAAEAAAPEGQLETAMPKFFLDMDKYRQQVQKPYVVAVNASEQEAIEKDEEVFRLKVPDVEEPQLNALAAHHLTEDDLFLPPPLITQIPFSITRLLAGRRTRFLKGEPLRLVEPAETPSYTNSLVFPLSCLRDLGPTRSGVLAQDMSLGAAAPRMMEDILQSLGDINDFPTADSIINIGVKGNILGNVTIKDWLTQLNIPLEGMGDAWRATKGYGADTIEWNTEQAAVIQEKVEQGLAGLRLFMIQQREENKTLLANMKFSPEGIIKPEDAARLLERIKSEPILKLVFERAQASMGDLALVDTNWFSYIFLTYPDFFLAALGGRPEPLVKERMRVEVDLFNKQLMDNYLLQKVRSDASAIEPVEENLCPHVKSLEAVRKAANAREGEPRDVTKIKLLIKLLNEFRGKSTDDWVDCAVCNKHLICAHELVNIQEFLRPAEKEILHKELVIKYSGGQFSGRFICRICGQGIAELDFDQSMEFDDEGRPMMGRSVMVDQNAIAEEMLDAMLAGGPSQVAEEYNFGNEGLNKMYKVLKRIAGGLGVDPEESDYRTMVENMSAYVSSLPDRKTYVADTAGKKAQDYDIFYSIRYVTAAAAAILLNVQTRIPDYVVYYTNTDCKDGFYGYPLEEGTAGAAPNVTGIQCVASVVAGINDNEFPWNTTTLQKTDNLVKRRDFVVPIIRIQIDEFLKHPMQQVALKRKRDYRTKLFGKVGGLKSDQIAKSFRPVPFILTEQEAAAELVMSEGSSPDKQATAWIRMAHRAARDSAALNPEAPLSETTSCLHSLRSPFEFWRAANMPPLEARITGQGARAGVIATTFYTEMPKGMEGAVDPKDYYKLFAALCWQGDNKGLVHRLGLTLTCSECGLNFKQNPGIPFSVEGDAKKAQEENAKGAADLQAHIVSQGIIINEATAQDLLNTARIRMSVSKGSRVDVPRITEALARLAVTAPIPFAGWGGLLADINTTLAELGDGATRIQIAKACERLVDQVSMREEFIVGRLGKDVFKYIESLTMKTPRECGEALSAFVLVPFKRWLTGLDMESFRILDSYLLTTETKNDIMVKGLGNYLRVIGEGKVLEGLLLRKTRAFVEDIGALCGHIMPSLRAIMIPGGEVMLRYLMRAYVIGVVQRYVDPQNIPVGEEELEDGIVDMKVVYRALAQAMTKYAVGAKVPSEDDIRFALEKRAEKEKQQFIGELDVMSQDKRRVELTLKSLGMGKWAAGGSKAIRQYDPERYELEREERAAAGIVDYGGEAPGTVDMFGFVDEGGTGGDRIDGDYTDGAMREDDY